jgi:acyl-CoA synthetase (NDP forming)
MTNDAPAAPRFQDLTRLFNPASIALVGASDRAGSIGALTLANIGEHSDFKGELYLVNPSRSQIGGRRCYARVVGLPAVPDVAVLVIPAAAVVTALEEAAALGVPFAVILTSGFGEADEEGKRAEAAIKAIAARTGIRVYGPNCPGLCNINNRLGLTFSPAFRHDLRKGPIGLATQGGGLGRNMMQAMERGAGFALWASSGNEADLQVADFIHYMAGAPDISVIVTLVEGIKDGPRFTAAVAHAARCGKPVVGLKVGRSEYGRRAAQSHTASITGSAEVNSAVFRQLGVIEVDDVDELIDVASLLARRPPDGREQVAVFASSGGAASLCADNVGAAGLTLAAFSDCTRASLEAVLPPYAAVSNPVDTTSVTISRPEVLSQSLLPVCEDENVSLVICPMALDYGAYTGKAARLMAEVQERTRTPIAPVWMSDRLGEGYQVLAAAGMVPFRSLRNMAKAVRRWTDYGAWRAAADIEWQPLILNAGVPGDPQATAPLTEIEGKARLEAAGVAVAGARLARTPAEAAELAAAIGRPLAMKIVSRQITHKSDIGGVMLNVSGSEAAAAAWDRIVTAARLARPDAVIDGVLVEPMAPTVGMEAFIGVARDATFGHIMTFGLGGVHVELFKDVTRRMLPVTPREAARMIDELRCAPLLRGVRGQAPSDLAALQRMIVAVSEFVCANAVEIEELDINPVWVGAEGQGAMALDAVIVRRA